MLGWLVGLGLASAAASAVGSALNYSSQKRQQDSNYDLQNESLQLQKDQFAYQKDYDVWQKNLAERNFQLQSSPISSLVKDGSSVGVNPMAALGQNIGSASVPSSNVNTSFGAGSVPLMDTGLSSMLSMMSNIITTGMNVKAETDIAKKNQALKSQELSIIEENNRANIGLGSERNSISWFEANIHKQLADANDRMTSLEFDKFAHNKVKDIKTYLLDKARFEYSKNFSERELEEKITQFNKKFDEQVREFNDNIKTADKDRRERYITSFISDVTRLLGSIFLGAGR